MAGSIEIKALDQCHEKTCLGCPHVDACIGMLRLQVDRLKVQKLSADKYTEELEKAFNEHAKELRDAKFLIKGLELQRESIIERVKQIICDNIKPDFNKSGKAICDFDAENGYKAIDQLIKKLDEVYACN